MAARVYFSAASAAEVSNTDSANYTDGGATLTFTATNAKDYVVFWSCLGQLNSTTDSCQVRLFESSTSTERVFQTWESCEVTTPIDYRPYGGMYKFTGAGASISFKIQVKREGAANTAKAKEFSIVALELGANDVIAESLARTTTTSGSAVTKVTMNITPGSQGDYLLVYTANADAGAGLTVGMDALVDGSSVIASIDNEVSKDATDRRTWSRIFKKTSWTAAAHTAAITYRAVDAGTVGAAEARILALRLSDFDANYYAENFTGATTTTTAYVDRVTLTDTITTAGDHLVMAAGDSQATNSASVSSYMDFTEDGTTLQETVQETPSGSVSDEILMPVFRIRDMTAASHTWKLRAKSETTSVATFSNGSIAVLQVESGSSLAVALAATEAQDTASLAISAQTGVTIAATEAADTAAIAISAQTGAALSAIESADLASIAMSSVALTGYGSGTYGTGPYGTILVTADVTLAATEAPDTAALAITAQTGATLAATEAADAAALAITAKTGVTIAATEAQDAAALALTAQTGVALAAIEAQDSAAFSLSSGTPIILSATEAQDAAALTASAQTGLSIAATEAKDAAAIAVTAAGGTLVMTVATTEAADIASFNLAYWQPIPDHSDIWVVQPPDGGIWTVVPPEHVT